MAERRWSKARLARRLADTLAPDPAAEVAGGEVTLARSGVVQLVSIYGDKHDADVLRWQVAFADHKYVEMMGRPAGWIWLGVRPRTSGLPWPTTGKDADEVLERIAPVAANALTLAPDRSALAALLLTPDPVSHEDYELDCILGNLPARLVQSVILARDIPDPRVEAAAMSLLAEPPVLGFREAVARQVVDRYHGKVDVDLSDLVGSSP